MGNRALNIVNFHRSTMTRVKKTENRQGSEFPDNPDNDGKQQAEKNHCRNGKIKPEILPFNTDIAWQAANPVQLIMKKIKDNAQHKEGRSDEDDIFSGFLVHQYFFLYIDFKFTR